MVVGDCKAMIIRETVGEVSAIMLVLVCYRKPKLKILAKYQSPKIYPCMTLYVS